MSPALPRPRADELAPAYLAYVDEVQGDDALAALEAGFLETQALVRRLGETRGGHRYAPGKWSVREIVGHLSDGERVFSYRAFRMSRGDRTPLASFDEDAYVAASGYDRRSLADLLEEFEYLRRASLALFRALDERAWAETGTASGKPFVVRAFPWIMAGHEAHHRRVLRERYA